MHEKKFSRGAYPRSQCVLIGVWVPREWLPKLDAIIREEDLDRSKLVRRALRQFLASDAHRPTQP